MKLTRKITLLIFFFPSSWSVKRGPEFLHALLVILDGRDPACFVLIVAIQILFCDWEK